MTVQIPISEQWPRIADEIWASKYRLAGPDGQPAERTFAETVGRVATAVAAAEAPDRCAQWARSFEAAMAGRQFVPGGRVLAGAGSGRRVTLFNCFVMGEIEDDLGSIFEAVKEAAQTMQAGGGIGQDFSTLRPKDAPLGGSGSQAAGPVAFMDVWDAMCRSIMSAGARRGAMMATLRCDHPDIEGFIDAKRDPARLRNFNLSVLVTDAFVAAVRDCKPWDLEFGGRVWRTVPARELWARLMRATYEVAEPGVIFIDRVNALNNLAYCETIVSTNPCGEQPLPPHGACLLGSINLARLVRAPFGAGAALDIARLEELAATAVRFLDDVIDVSFYPLAAQEQEAKRKRRIGLGVTGLADALIMLGVRYGSPEGCRLAADWLGRIKHVAYETSAALAEEKGSFPLCDAEALLGRPNLQVLPAPLKARIARTGLRNGLLTTIAPTGTTSLLAGNVSSGIEPVFDFEFSRRVTGSDGVRRDERVQDYATRVFRENFGPAVPLPPAFVSAAGLSPADHLAMQAAAQPHVDSAISKTINCPASITFDDFQSIYLDAHRLGLKGCTAWRPNSVTGAILVADAPAPSTTADATTTVPNAPAPGGSADERKDAVVSMSQPAELAVCPDCGSAAFFGPGLCGTCLTCGRSRCE